MKKQDNLTRIGEKFITCSKEIGEATIEPICDRLANIYENEDVPQKIGFKIVGEGEFEVTYELTTPFDNKVFLYKENAKSNEEIYNYPDKSENATFKRFIDKLYKSNEENAKLSKQQDELKKVIDSTIEVIGQTEEKPKTRKKSAEKVVEEVKEEQPVEQKPEDEQKSEPIQQEASELVQTEESQPVVENEADENNFNTVQELANKMNSDNK